MSLRPQDYSNMAAIAVGKTMYGAQEEINAFCKILGYALNDYNELIGRDPHGCLDMQEGYRVFNMTDVHTVLSDYPEWMRIYGSNEEIRKAVDTWYFYTLGIAEHNHDLEEKKKWVSVEERLPDKWKEIDVSTIDGKKEKAWITRDVLVRDEEACVVAFYDYGAEEWLLPAMMGSCADFLIEPKYWMPLLEVGEENAIPSPNLKTWLLGWRPREEDILPEWKELREKEKAAAAERRAQAQADLEKAINEYNPDKPY